MITDKELIRLIDGELKEEERNALMKRIEADPDLKKKYDQTIQTEDLLSVSPVLEPSSHFTSNVMRNLSKRFSEELSRSRFSGKHMIIAMVVIAVGLVAAIALLSQPSLGGIIPEMEPQTFSFKERTINLNPGNWINQDVFFKGLIYLNAFLGIFLLERAILRPFFLHRRQRMSF